MTLGAVRAMSVEEYYGWIEYLRIKAKAQKGRGSMSRKERIEMGG